MPLPHSLGKKATRRSSRRGAALIIVLSAVMLLMVLMLSFLTSVSSELQSSKIYAYGSSQKLLVQSAVNLVIGQIRVATADSQSCWASQPGMLRTYDTQGLPTGYYKLYSDDSMQGSGKFDHTQSANAIPADWFSRKGAYVDLNQPATVGGVQYYPILDGASGDQVTFSSPFTGTPVTGLGPLTSGRPSVEGFWLGSETPVEANSLNRAPMPVKWLYVLQDGKIISPDSDSKNGKVTFAQAGTKPSESNPIVGRMAFWTDDETCKININTASEGTFWDSPRTYTMQDYYLATRQPVQGEFQRYPGHPATVCLSTVLDLSNAKKTWLPEAPFSQEDIFALSPAFEPGGSIGGTFDTVPTSNTISSSISRLYSSVDEFLFQTSLSNDVRQPNSLLLQTPDALNVATLRKSRFFLTANSQAPDVNVFNLPRVSVWPITLNKGSGTQALTAFDKLLSYCTTVNGHSYYFQRQDPTSESVDLPKFGSSSGLGRNRDLLEYLRKLTSLPIPGFGPGSFAQKYEDDHAQVLTEIFDYIRTTNLQDSSTGATVYAPSYDNNSASNSYQGGSGQVVPIVDSTISVKDSVTGSSTHPRGFGRFPTLQQAFVVFIRAGDKQLTTTNAGVIGFPGTYPKITDDSIRVQAGFFLQMFDPAHGTPVTYPWYEVRVENLDMSWSNTSGGSYSMGFPASGKISKPYARTALGVLLYGGVEDYRVFTYTRDDASNAATKYPFITPPTGLTGGAICPDMNNGAIYFKGGSAVVKIFALDASGNAGASPLQTATLSFPAATLPLPGSPSELTTTSTVSTALKYTSFYKSATVKGRLGVNNQSASFGSIDVIRGIVATPGDMRLIAARTDVAKDFYQPLKAPAGASGVDYDYNSSTARMSHMVRYYLNCPIYGAAGGKLVNVAYGNYKDQYCVSGTPGSDNSNNNFGASGYYSTKDIVVPTQTGVTNSTPVADWDNGLANATDGAYINRPDEGDAGRAGTNGTPYFELDYGSALPGPTFFSPNRMIPSAGMLGSLPTGVFKDVPWQTLLFRPGPANHAGLGTAASTTYPSAPPYTSPPDHLLLDLFNMPVVEPYAISTPLATAGRINMNYLIVPFTYIHRDTGVRAAMKAQMMTCIGNPSYKTRQNPNGTPTTGNKPATLTVRYPINADATLSQFESRFKSGDIFRAASEICSVDLVPNDSKAPLISNLNRSSMDQYWNTNYPLSGDNIRERPYANLYPLLTTKSNTYTVHYRVQLLKQVTNTSDYATWREGTDLVTGEHRGSQTIERYIDPNDDLPDYATGAYPPTQPLNRFYKFRIVATRQFSP